MSDESMLSWLCACFRLNRLIARLRTPCFELARFPGRIVSGSEVRNGGSETVCGRMGRPSLDLRGLLPASPSELALRQVRERIAANARRPRSSLLARSAQ